MKLSKKIASIFCLLLVLALSACGQRTPVDPHAGMIQVYNGIDKAWVRPWSGAAESGFTEADFSTGEDGVITYTGTQYCVEQGVDVSYFQGDIDWNAVAASGVSFAYIQAGFRGYESGEIRADMRYEQNAAAALAAGLEIGFYFFSQAVTPEEAAEEAQWLLEAAEPFDATLPFAFDWEAQTASDGGEVRTEGMLGSEMTACAAAFCETIRDAGKVPAVYGNRWQGYYDYDLSRLGDAELWISAPGTWDDFHYAHSIWQYTYEGSVPGIPNPVDRNLRYLPITE